MSIEDKIKLIPRELKSDGRGWFLKVITGKEDHLSPQVGEVYLVMAHPGQMRGGHYHRRTNEWFTVIQGTAVAVLIDPATGERIECRIGESNPITLFVPAGIAHVFQNPDSSQEAMLLIAYADQPYDPWDTIEFLMSESLREEDKDEQYLA